MRLPRNAAMFISHGTGAYPFVSSRASRSGEAQRIHDSIKTLPVFRGAWVNGSAPPASEVNTLRP